MDQTYLVKGKKIVTVSRHGTISNGGILVEEGKIKAIGPFEKIKRDHPSISVLDYSEWTITPSLVDCHTHLLEFAPSLLYPITAATQLWAGKSLFLKALASGITAFGEQICGNPTTSLTIKDYRKAAADLPLDIVFATASISIGLSECAHFSAVTQNKALRQSDLANNEVVKKIAAESDYPGENVFINATPANFTQKVVPRAGEIMYTLEQLKEIVKIYHMQNKQIGAHAAGEEGIQLALNAGIDVLHHAHGITENLLIQAVRQETKMVATPLGGTHLTPNSPAQITEWVEKGLTVSIATDAYLPPYPDVSWLPFSNEQPQGPEVLMKIAHPSMSVMKRKGMDENRILSLITANPANLLGNGHKFGKLDIGMDATFLAADGIPGIECTEPHQIKAVFVKGKKMINRV